MSDYPELEESLGITFRDKSLLERALVHRSYLNENPDFPLPHNERLEFLGDAILDFLVGEFLYHRCPEMREGKLTSLRSALVRTEMLANLARQMKLGNYLYLGHGEEHSGGRDRDALLCDAFEALIGAVYLDQGLEVTRDLVYRLIRPAARRIFRRRLDRDPKSVLQEFSQAEFGITPVYKTVREEGPDHAKQFTVAVLIDKVAWGQGKGRSKQAAEQAAAEEALKALRQSPDSNTVTGGTRHRSPPAATTCSFLPAGALRSALLCPLPPDGQRTGDPGQ